MGIGGNGKGLKGRGDYVGRIEGGGRGGALFFYIYFLFSFFSSLFLLGGGRGGGVGMCMCGVCVGK